MSAMNDGLELRDYVLAGINAIVGNEAANEEVADSVMRAISAWQREVQVKSLNVDSIEGDRMTISRSLRKVNP